MSRQKVLTGFAFLFVLTTALTAAFFAAEYVTLNPGLQTFIASYGYFGVTLLAIVTGLNVLVPIPAAAAVPVFLAAGLSFWPIVIFLTIGTVIADFVGYIFGRLSRDVVHNKYPAQTKRFTEMYAKRRAWILPIIFLYCAFAPLPNEAIVIPLGLLGMRWYVIVIPLLLGNFVSQAVYAYGMQNAFLYLF